MGTYLGRLRKRRDARHQVVVIQVQTLRDGAEVLFFQNLARQDQG